MKLSLKDHRDQMKVLNYFDKFYAKSVNIFLLALPVKRKEKADVKNLKPANLGAGLH